MIREEFNLSDDYKTPKWLMNIFKDWFDPCPIHGKGGLEIEWKNKTYVNPPYSNPLKWVRKAIEENRKGKIIVMLLRVDTSTEYFKELVNADAHILFINKRLKFINNKPANFPSMLVILAGDKLLEDR